VPPERYFRFNPRMNDMPIDETRIERLNWLKALSKEYFNEPATRARLDTLAKKLKPSFW
jgi:hypothetical protein